MEILFAAQALWSRKLLVLAGLVAAVAVAVLYSSRPAPAGSGAAAWGRVILDTPKSQLVDAAPSAAETLPWRAQMLANLMKTKESTQRLATGMGVPVTDVDVVNQTLVDPPVPASLPTAASKSAALVYAPYVVSAYLPSLLLPVIVVYATAPTVDAAKKLASVAVNVLHEQTTKPGTYTSKITTLKAQPVLEAYDVRQVAPILSESQAVTPSPLIPLVVALVAFIMWCFGIVFVLAPFSRWRARRVRFVPA